jgi:NAD(P)-dependent dehydrogenase (short-subunit alcohol dehydrogenase family)
MAKPEPEAAASLAGKVVLVTGAAKRIGRGIALRLASEGARVAIHYGQSGAEARQTAEECGGAPVFKANLESVAEIQRMFQEVEARCGRLDGLVNNAARFTRFDPLAITEADWDFIHSVNLKAVFFCCQQGALLMKKSGGGRIVNISSLGGIKPWAAHAHYCASKAGVIMLTRALAKAFAPEITVNSVAPGVIPFSDIDERGLAMIAATPAARGGTPAEIAEAVVYFLKASNFVTGQLLAVDGGLSQR